MHEAYKSQLLLKHTVQIESIAAYENNLILGTRQGYLLKYNVVTTANDKLQVELMIFNKNFSKKPIQQLEVIPQYHLLVSLTDNIVQVHDIKSINLQFIHQVPNTKGANLFTLNIQNITSSTGVSTTVVRMCVAVKRKLQLYYWKNNEFNSFDEDVNLTDIPKALSWCQETICVGYKGEYSLYELNKKPVELFPTSSSRSSDPCIVKASETTFALGREMKTVLVNVKGVPEKNKALEWSDVPTALEWDEPYALGLLSDCIEIQTIEPVGVIQTITDLPKVRLIIRCNQGLLYAASVSNVWCIRAIDIPTQRKVLLENKQFQLALQLTSLSDESEDDKNLMIHHIQTLLAEDLFNKKQFSESMKEFIKLDTDPYEVIKLFPNLLPQTGNDTNDVSTTLSDKELENGLQALIEYLTEVRLKKQQAKEGNFLTNDSDRNDRTTQKLLQIIDTTLLKCYLQTNDALVAPLLRRNHCHLGEAERTLKKYGKHNELIILYQTKGQHRRALELLQSEGSVERSINYLQHLGYDNMGLILEFADWILEKSPEEGLKIFIEDLAEVEALPRPRILDYLLKTHVSLVIPYLEHVIHTWEDTSPLFHNFLVHQYREKALSDDPTATVIRKKLAEFLEKSTHYAPESVLSYFPPNELLEERAVILGRLGKHEEALAIHVRVLGDVNKAIIYCNKVYEINKEVAKEVYVILIKLILNPNSVQINLPGVSLSPKTAQPDLESALKLMEEYASRINYLSILNELPDDIQVSRIQKFLQVALHDFLKERRRLQLLKGLLYAEQLQCKELQYHLESQHVLITEMNICPVCKKRFGNQSALVRYPNGDVVHYSCHDKKL